MFDSDPCSPASFLRADSACALSHAQWIELAMQQLRAQWPDADARRLRDIADELFADPRSGLLDPQQAVNDWLCLLGAAPPLHQALPGVDVAR